MRTDLKSRYYLKQLFFEYYYMNMERILRGIERMSQREIACVPFEEETMIRHIGVKDEDDLSRLIAEKVPLHLYHSAAYYLFPEREIEKKGLIGCDLVFDIDADQLTKAKVKRIYVCKRCHEVYSSKRDVCDRCHGKIEEVEWIDEEDLQLAKNEVRRLYKVLVDEFGIDPNNIKTYFSGDRGYHLHVSGEQIENLDPSSRIEIVNYLKLTGYDLRYEGDRKRRTSRILFKILGYKEREFLSRLREEEKERIKKISEKLDEDNLRDVLRGMKMDLKSKIEEYIIEKEGIRIDPVVTADMHRLIRFPGSIHGKSGMTKERVKEIEDFDPFKHAVKLPGRKVKIHVRYSPKFYLMDDEYGPFSEEEVTLPGYVAAFLMCKGLAEIAS